MSRNRYTRLVHDLDEAQLNQQIRDACHLESVLRRESVEAVGPARGRARLAQQRRHKKLRPENTQS